MVKGGINFMIIGSLIFPMMFPQTTVCIANIQVVPLVGTSVQVTVVWLMVTGHGAAATV